MYVIPIGILLETVHSTLKTIKCHFQSTLRLWNELNNEVSSSPHPFCSLKQSKGSNA